MSTPKPQGRYKLLKVPADQILSLTDGPPAQAVVAAESSVCNCDTFKAGPFEVAADILPVAAAVELADKWDTEASRLHALAGTEKDPQSRIAISLRAQAFEDCARELRAATEKG